MDVGFRLSPVRPGMSPFVRRLLLILWVFLGAALLFMACSQIPDEEAATDQSTPTSTDEAAEETPPSTTLVTTTTAPSTTTSEPPTTTTTTTPPDQLEAPVDAPGLAAALTEAELGIRATDIGDEERAAWGRRQQQLYRILSGNRVWGDEVTASVDDEVRLAVENNWLARQNLSALVQSVQLSSTLPAWKIFEPLGADELLGYYKEAEEQTGIPWEYLAAINLIETRMGRIQGLSTAGATGPMQFLPSTFAECCQGDPNLDRDAIIGAAVYLDQRGGPEDMVSAVRGYNRSDRYEAAVRSYVRVLEDNEDAYRGYHAWEVYFLSSAGLIRMPSGYEEAEPVDAATWLADNPEALVN